MLLFVDMEQLNELEQEHKFILKNEKRKALEHILMNLDSGNFSFLDSKKIEIHPLPHYQQKAISFMSLYGAKLMRKVMEKNN